MEENSKNTKVKSKKSMIVVAATLALLALCVIVA